ncbi:MAG: DUF58 domain-containing protein [Candidatus Acidiferrales bacterium]
MSASPTATIGEAQERAFEAGFTRESHAVNSPHTLIPPAVAARGRSAGRFPFAFGRRFFLLLLIGLVWIGPAWWDAHYLYAMVLWDMLVFALWASDLSRMPKPEQLEIRRLWSTPPQLSAESLITLELRVSAGIEISGSLVDDVPTALRDSLPELSFSTRQGQPASITFTIRPRERGDARFGATSVRYQSAWRIAERWAAFDATQSIRVYPNLEESKRETIHLIRSRQTTVEKRLERLRGQGREFESLREYREGDDLRDACWTATARRAKVIIKSYQVERSQTVWLVLDTGRLMRARTKGLSKLDYSVGAALTLAQVALYSGDKVAALAYGRKTRMRLPAARGANHVRAMLEGFSQLHGETHEADHIRAAESLLAYQKRRSLVVWLTDLTETAAMPDVIEAALRLAHRHVLLFTVIGEPDLRALLEARPESDRGMFRYAAAQEIAHRRDLLLRMLRQQGALTIEVEPSRLSSAVVNRYLQVKERSLI